MKLCRILYDRRNKVRVEEKLKDDDEWKEEEDEEETGETENEERKDKKI